MDPIAIAMTVTQGIRLVAIIADQLDAMNRGEITPEQVHEQWAAMGIRVDVANDAWEAARARKAARDGVNPR